MAMQKKMKKVSFLNEVPVYKAHVGDSLILLLAIMQ